MAADGERFAQDCGPRWFPHQSENVRARLASCQGLVNNVVGFFQHQRPGACEGSPPYLFPFCAGDGVPLTRQILPEGLLRRVDEALMAAW